MECYKNILKKIKESELKEGLLEEITMNSYMLELETLQKDYLSKIENTERNIEISSPSEINKNMIRMNKISKKILSIILKIDCKDIEDNNKKLFEQKNKDYGSSYKDFGLIGIIVRLNDKINRLKRLTISKDINIVDEKIEDTINDLYNYTILALMCNN